MSRTITIFFCRKCQKPFRARKGKGGRTYCETHAVSEAMAKETSR